MSASIRTRAVVALRHAAERLTLLAEKGKGGKEVASNGR
jgi:hypothetical protein